MLNHFTHESKIPECCRRCFYIRKASKNSKFKRCSLKIIMPVKKQSCAKQKDSAIYLFWLFLKENGVLSEYVWRYRLKSSKLWRKSSGYNGILGSPLLYIFNAFIWPDDNNRWYSLDQDWVELFESHYEFKNLEWRPK